MLNKNIRKNCGKYGNGIFFRTDGVLGDIEREARSEGLPVISPETAGFISVLLALKRPKKVLEIGCCIGFSCGLIAEHLEEGGRIITIDRYDCMIERARANFKRLGINDKVTLIEGHAQEILPMLGGGFDFIFVDASKGQYPEFLRQSIRLLTKGGVLVFDDVFQEGRIELDSLQIPRRQRTIHKRMNAFLHMLESAHGLESSIIPLGDGLAFCVKTDDKVMLDDI